MITFEEPEVAYCFSVKGFEFMMDSILKDTYLVQIAVADNTDNALQRVLNIYERTSRRLCAMKRIEEIKVSRLNK
ncbi:hypothetical protein G17_00562 [Escherichia phage vB_EcoM_G17]|uniref:hypothetical protein n=1 Tax=Escherichia coli TaxID=562 RepID=UPI0010B7CEFA|nr:hypothetical protein [Escherichia coli]MED6924657.1 hypothetical protein [Escherichia coli O157]QBO62051.1 hypothetical protein G17_00562 [Escherichia phage vB_EcoM_G17]QDF14071.1 hypothetical protein vBEcoMphAPEC6_gp448c [Escherichia phage vB_EcoM_phAPEC6]WNN14290.1 hypothetical protein Sharanji_gp002 [Escherichia phage Sharanji]